LHTQSAIEPGKVELTVLVPAYEEAENLRRLLPRINAVISQLRITAQVIVIEAASPVDDTAGVCSENRVTCIARTGGNDYGDALRTGIMASVGDYVVVMDADGSHNPSFLKTMWPYRQSYDVVIASRYARGGKTDNPLGLVLLSRLLNALFKVVVGMPVLDVSNSFRLYRGSRLRELSLTMKHFDIMEEILAKLIWNEDCTTGSTIELPYHFEKRLSGKSKRNLIVFGWNFMLVMRRLRRHRSGHTQGSQAREMPEGTK
jgi:dolichol-phosphate mannosyltransferase